MPDKVIILDTTLRDGEQSAGVLFSVRDKLDIAERLASMRVDVIEAGFPAASAGELAAVRSVVGHVRTTTICALARCVEGDVDAAAQALVGAASPRIHLFINASDVQIERQLRKTRADVIALAAAAVSKARHTVADVEFSAMDATRADPAFLAELVRAALKAGARTINVPDTVGYALPDDVRALIQRLRADVPELEQAVLSFHGQNDLGMASANSIAALVAGARQVEVCVNGIGERAGNTALEEIVMILAVHGTALGLRSDVDATGICTLSALVEERSRIPVAPNKSVVGRNAFRHASGVHQDGILKHRESFECMDPAWIGHSRGTEIVLGKLSGTAGFAARCRALGLDVRGEALAQAMARFQALADVKAELTDDDVRTLCQASPS